MRHETAGDPMSGLKWTRKTTAKIAEALNQLDVSVSPKTVARLLKKMNYSLRVNHKKRSFGSSPDRDEQFRYLNHLRGWFTGRGEPVISVDTKKRELIGEFKNPGVTWEREPIAVKDHDFRTEALGVGIPYGIYDLQANRGHVFIGVSYNTPEFAVDSIQSWWSLEGRARYPSAAKLLILADSGGSNGVTPRLWKLALQQRLCDRHGLCVTVCHYPSGASKWNPIEHRLFGEISKNWAGKPLDSYETMLKYIRTTKTESGLRVRARLVTKQYEKGRKVSDAEMREMQIARPKKLIRWNYTLRPSVEM